MSGRLRLLVRLFGPANLGGTRVSTDMRGPHGEGRGPRSSRIRNLDWWQLGASPLYINIRKGGRIPSHSVWGVPSLRLLLASYSARQLRRLLFDLTATCAIPGRLESPALSCVCSSSSKRPRRTLSPPLPPRAGPAGPTPDSAVLPVSFRLPVAGARGRCRAISAGDPASRPRKAAGPRGARAPSEAPAPGPTRKRPPTLGRGSWPGVALASGHAKQETRPPNPA